MDEKKTIEAEARDYVDRVLRMGNQDPEKIPPEVLERAVKAAADSAAELHEAAQMAQEEAS
jgi:hypothetical protein